MKRGMVRAGELLAAVFVIAMVAGQLLGQPVLLSYVTTGSMAPTLDPGDGFVAVPSAVAGPIEEGDVVTFRAEELHGGGLTTHRVVGETDRGYVTRGDANPFADQDGNEPPVKEGQIVAVAWQPGGTVLAIPSVGTGVDGSQRALAGTQRWLAAQLGTRSLLGTSGLAYLVFGVSMAWYLTEAYRDRDTGDRDRDRSRDDGFDPRLVIGLFALVIVASATAAMVAPAGAQKYGVVSAEFDAPGPRVIETGTDETVRYPVDNGGLVPVVSYLEPASEGVAVEPRSVSVGSRSLANATVTLSAPPETGFYRRFVTEHRYLALLPRAHIGALYQLHPWLPVVVIDAMLGGAFYAIGVSVIGTGRIRSRRRGGRSSGFLSRVLP